MDMKGHILTALREQIERWEELLSSLSEEQITASRFDYDWSIKDVVNHLWAWQQISVARIEAGAQNREPEFPSWVSGLGGDWEEEADRTNARIYEMQHSKPWSKVHRNWRDGYLRLIESAESIAEKDLMDSDRFPWLNGYSLAFVLVASYDHHQEHLDKLIPELREHADTKMGG